MPQIRHHDKSHYNVCMGPRSLVCQKEGLCVEWLALLNGLTRPVVCNIATGGMPKQIRNTSFNINDRNDNNARSERKFVLVKRRVGKIRSCMALVPLNLLDLVVPWCSVRWSCGKGNLAEQWGSWTKQVQKCVGVRESITRYVQKTGNCTATFQLKRCCANSL